VYYRQDGYILAAEGKYTQLHQLVGNSNLFAPRGDNSAVSIQQLTYGRMALGKHQATSLALRTERGCCILGKLLGLLLVTLGSAR